MKMSTKTTTTATEASAEDRRRVQGIGDDDVGGRGLTKGPVDWQRQRRWKWINDRPCLLEMKKLC